jgi:hypothetical protein
MTLAELQRQLDEAMVPREPLDRQENEPLEAWRQRLEHEERIARIMAEIENERQL